MAKEVNLIVTDSYFNTFSVLVEELKKTAKGLDKKNLVFCEEKNSLMAERWICNTFGGTFNTSVFSFSKFLRSKKQIDDVLDKQGSIMAIKRIVNKAELKCLSKSKSTLAPSLYNLIVQLKSSKITPKTLLATIENKGNKTIESGELELNVVLKNKLTDIYTVYDKYEEFLKDKNITSEEEAMALLNKEFDGRYYLRTIANNGMLKIAEDYAEKHMTLAATAPLGSINENISKSFTTT